MSAPKDLDSTVHFDLDLNTVIGHESDRNDDGDYVGHVPVTLGDRVAEIIASRLIQQAGRDWHPSVTADAKATADRLVEEKFREVLEREFVPTDNYGAPKGSPTTIGELIVSRVEAWVSEPLPRDGYSSTRGTKLQALIDDVVNRKFEAEVKKAVATAQAQATAAVSAKAGEVFAEIIKRAAS